MAKYEKWLGAGLGWILTGSPLGSLLGFITGSMIEGGEQNKEKQIPDGVSEFEVNLMVLASHLIKIDGVAKDEEISFTLNFLNTHFNDHFAAQRLQILNHCLQKEYDLTNACHQIRTYTQHGTKIQVIHFLLDLASCDGALNERENYFVFKIAGYLNVNDVNFRKIKGEHLEVNISVYDTLGVSRDMQFSEIRAAYRKLVLKYHPDRNKDMTEEQKKNLARKFQQIQEAYEKIKSERGGK